MGEERHQLRLSDDVAGHGALQVDDRRARLQRQWAVKREELERVVMWRAAGRWTGPGVAVGSPSVLTL